MTATAAATTTFTAAADAATTRQERLDHGLEVLGRIDGDAGEAVLSSLSDVSPELAHQIAAWGFGEIYARPELAPRDRQLVTLGMLTALGGCEPQLRVHVNAALNVGLSPQEIVEALLHSAVYCGFPRALNATFAAKQVFAERGLLPVTPATPATATGPAAATALPATATATAA
ncbi:carboxymuconolactone decarboxylase family protein [Kitasatospora sp. NA04385]|uniref:carboxymuconolactone decarboxylase family protein n=1 Tax=Kitasatospora sp. NA04385 TaxID=2742135 RepID=UPI0015902DB8|nr:carboxymuconolactone decarboxylase family protein [Kitasatospora sp. NA04385]QKW23386.1 carboxymuconolactone decarboxylase family protein [Kitasatospora sp. NA04385]